MMFRGLAWRVGWPFLALVVAETVTLAIYLTSGVAAEERARLERLAAENAALIDRKSLLPPTERLAEDIRRVAGVEVFFRSGSHVVPKPADQALVAALAAVPAEGHARDCGSQIAVAVPLDDRWELLLVRDQPFLDGRVVLVLAAFVAFASAFTWLAVRNLVRPLRGLAAALPGIDRGGAIAVPEASRPDEIGDVARAFVAARQALHDEREQRARMEKLAVLGRMTASLAHEIQNPVAAIKMHAQLARGTGADEMAAVVEQEAARIEDLVHQWLFLSRPEPPALSPCDLGALVDELVQSQQKRIEHARVELAVRRRGELRVEGDRKRLRVVFGNLLGNALQAMPNGGTLAIELLGGGDHVDVRFVDSGTGFSTAALAHFGEFFFSEKEGGMGIGLGVAREVVAAHGGTLRGANVPGGGACVTVVLPRTAARGGAGAGDAAAAPPHVAAEAS